MYWVTWEACFLDTIQDLEDLERPWSMLDGL